MANTYSSGSTANVGNNAAYLTVDGVDSGLVIAPWDFEHLLETSANQFAQDSSPRGARVDSQTITLSCVLAEVTNANFKHYLAGLSSINGSALVYGDKKGQALTTYEVKLFPLHADGHPWAGQVITLHKAYIVPNGVVSIDPTNTDFEGYPIQFIATKDSTQTAGEEFFSKDAVDTTPPTVTLTDPVDGASGVAVDDAPNITFSKAMATGTFIANESVIVASTAKTSQAYTDQITISGLSFNAAKLILTIAHTADDYTASTEYQVILTEAIKSSDGVGLGSVYVFDFTTA